MERIPNDLVCGGPEGRSGTELLWAACCVCGVVPLWFFRTFLSPPEEPPSDAGGGSVFLETTLEAPAPHVHSDARNGAGASFMETE